MGGHRRRYEGGTGHKGQQDEIRPRCIYADKEGVHKQAPVPGKGPWYPWALNRLEVDVTFGMRNRIERWFRTLKRRTKVFCNNINQRRGGLKDITTFLELYAMWYRLRYHQSLGRCPSYVA